MATTFSFKFCSVRKLFALADCKQIWCYFLSPDEGNVVTCGGVHFLVHCAAKKFYALPTLR